MAADLILCSEEHSTRALKIGPEVVIEVEPSRKFIHRLNESCLDFGRSRIRGLGLVSGLTQSVVQNMILVSNWPIKRTVRY
jgi:hypothetical protein